MMESQPKTVVVAEDETLIRIVAINVLTDAGFAVIEAGHAEAALIAIRSRAGAIHLLFTDIEMPGQMNGLELAHYVQTTWPRVALLITSGADTPRVTLLPAGSIFLRKPYDLSHVVTHAKTLTAA